MFDNQENKITTFNLDQGKDILQYNDDMDKIVGPNLKLIQSNLLKEGLDGSNMSYTNKKALEGLQNIENKFKYYIDWCGSLFWVEIPSTKNDKIKEIKK